jgi:hypothetical protein
MNRIKLAYDWIGPTKVYDNNQPFTISSPLSNLRTNTLSHVYFEKVNGYEPIPSLLLKNEDVLKIRNLRGKLSQAKIAERFKISQSYVSEIQLKKTWEWLKDEK